MKQMIEILFYSPKAIKENESKALMEFKKTFKEILHMDYEPTLADKNNPVYLWAQIFTNEYELDFKKIDEIALKYDVLYSVLEDNIDAEKPKRKKDNLGYFKECNYYLHSKIEPYLMNGFHTLEDAVYSAYGYYIKGRKGAPSYELLLESAIHAIENKKSFLEIVNKKLNVCLEIGRIKES